MRILWTVNIMMDEADALLGSQRQSLSSGGWLQGAANALASCPDISLSIACPSPKVAALTILRGESITYYVFPGFDRHGGLLTGYKPSLDGVFKKIIEKSQPELIDIQGSEFAHSMSCLISAGNIPVALTVQGILGVCKDHFWDGIEQYRPFFPGRDSISRQERDFRRRARVEARLYGRVAHFIGRTDWDRAESLALNPKASYHHCNRILRSAFYNGKWEYSSCIPHRIFVSQAMYSLKGFHQLIKALPEVVEAYPDTTVAVGGGGFGSDSYGKILQRMIRERNLESHIQILDTLDAEQMKEQFLLSNVYVLPSSIENESISLSEAQILGVPVIASRVGGVPSSFPDPGCGRMYPYSDTGMLSRLIIDAFENAAGFDNTHQRQIAAERLDIKTNTERLVQIYKWIITSS